MPFSADIFYRQYEWGEEGKGFPVILLHGGGGTHLSWPSELRRIPGYRIIAVDLPGHGNSKNPACRSMNGLTNRLREFITEMGLYHTVLVGFSLGGALALELALAMKSRIKGLALISCGYRFTIPDGIATSLRPPVNMARAMRIFGQAAFHPKTTPAFCQKILDPLEQTDPQVLAADIHISRVYRQNPTEAKLDMPVGILAGAEDQITPPAAVRPMKSLSSRSMLNMIPGAGHMVAYEQISQVRKWLAGFLSSIN